MRLEWRIWIALQTVISLLITGLVHYSHRPPTYGFLYPLIFGLLGGIILLLTLSSRQLQYILGTTLLGLTPYAVTSQTLTIALGQINSFPVRSPNYALVTLTLLYLTIYGITCYRTLYSLTTTHLLPYDTIHGRTTATLICVFFSSLIITTSTYLLTTIQPPQIMALSHGTLLYLSILTLPTLIFLALPIRYIITRLKHDYAIWRRLRSNRPNQSIGIDYQNEPNLQAAAVRLFGVYPVILTVDHSLQEATRDAIYAHEGNHLKHGHSLIPRLLGLMGPLLGGRTPILIAFDLAQLELSSDKAARNATSREAIARAIMTLSTSQNPDPPQESYKMYLDAPYRLLYGQEIQQATAPSRQRRFRELFNDSISETDS